TTARRRPSFWGSLFGRCATAWSGWGSSSAPLLGRSTASRFFTSRPQRCSALPCNRLNVCHKLFVARVFLVGCVRDRLFQTRSPPMKRFASSVVLAVSMLLLPVTSQATLITLGGILNAAAENNPMDNSPATGFASVTLDTAAQTLHIVLVFS